MKKRGCRTLIEALGEETLARYKSVKARARSHPPDFNAAMMRICAKLVDEERPDEEGQPS